MCQITIDRIIVSILLLDPVADKERSWIMQSKTPIFQKCSKCGEIKPIAKFYYRKDQSKYRTVCIKCCRSRCKEYVKTDRWKKLSKEYYKKNREHLLELKRQYYKKPHIKAHRNKYLRERRKNDLIFNLNHSMSRGMRMSLKRNGGKTKKDHWESIVGYTVKQLKSHLEKQFQPGMSWDNHGEWHIDHKIPISKFNFSSIEHEDFKRCWDMKNLQPLWAKDNLSKGNTLNKPFQPSLSI